MHNYFCIKTEQGAVKSFNQLNNIFPIYAKGARLCKYIYITTETNETVFKDAKLCSKNFNSINGVLYACYETALDANELKEKTITRIGFAYDANLGSVVNECQFSYTKKAGERLMINGAIYLNQSGLRAKFCGGDNPLIEALLGACEFPKSGFQLAAGGNYMPQISSYRDTNDILEKVDCLPQFSQNSISFEAKLNSNINEVLLLFYGSPVMRIKPQLSGALAIEQLESTNKGFVKLANKFITELFNVRVDNQQVINYSLQRLMDKAFVCNSLPYCLNKSSQIYSDPSKQIFAEFDNGEITFYKQEEGGIVPFYYARGNGVSICADGALVVYYNNSFKIIKDGERIFNTSISNNSETIYNNGHYLCASVLGESVLLHKIDNNNNLVTMVLDYEGKQVGLINLDSAICVVAKGVPVRVFTPFGEDNALASWFNVNLNFIVYNLDSKPYFDNQRLIVNHYTGECSFIEYPSTDIKTLMTAKILGGVALGYDEQRNVTSVYDVSLTNFLFETAGKIKNVFNKGDMLYVFLEDGGFISYLVSSKNSKLVSPSIKVNSTVSCYAIKDQEKSGTVRLEMTG